MAVYEWNVLRPRHVAGVVSAPEAAGKLDADERYDGSETAKSHERDNLQC